MKDDRLYLIHIRDSIDKIIRYSRGGKEAFFADEKTQDATIRNLEIIGEAAKQLSPEGRARQADVSWKRIAGMRDVLIHGYMGVKLELVWDVITEHLPQLHKVVLELLDDS